MATIVAHRGASKYATDNTLTSYRLAHAQGAGMIELDIRPSADGLPLVYHDASVNVPGVGERRVERMTLAELLRVPLAGDERIPRWEDVIALCRELDLGIYVEFKDTTEALTAQVIDSLRQARWLDRCILFGSRPDHVFFVKEYEPAARTCFSYRQAGIDPVLIARVCRADGLNLAWEDYPDPCAKVTPGWLASARAAGLRLMSWHEEREPVLRQLIALGLDDLCTNDPALTARLLRETGNA